MIDIPNEIWEQIAQYLPSTTLRNLYSLNHAFYHIAMNQRYGKVFFHPSQCRREFTRLRDPSIAIRVHELHLHPPSLLAELKRNIRPLNQLWNKTTPHMPTSWTANGAAKKLCHTLNALTRLQVLHLYYDRPKDTLFIGHSRMLAQVTWPIMGSHLRELALYGTTQMLYDALFSFSPVFSKLESLSITFPYFGSQNNSATMRAALASFVNSHNSTVRSLELLDFGVRGHVVSSLLPHLVHFPRLTKFGVRGRTSDQHGASLRHILHLHPQLLELDILNCDASDLHVQHEIELPMLKSLYLGIFCPVPLTPQVTGITVFLHHSLHSLTTLVLDYHRFDYDDVCMITEVLSQKDKLRMLSLKLRFLIVQFFDLFALRLPNLHELHLSVIGFTDLELESDSDIPQKEETFCQQLMKRDYFAWNLRRLYVEACLPVAWAGHQRLNYRSTAMDSAKCGNILRRPFQRTDCIVETSVTLLHGRAFSG